MKTMIDVQIYEGSAQLGEAAAQQWLEMLRESHNESFFVALSGGRSASALFSAMAKPENAEILKKVHFFWADERCLPPTDRESNFHMATELFFTPLEVESAQIHRIRGEFPPEKAVVQANEEISAVMPENETGLPVFDLVFLGLGEDGHVASLFPNAPIDVIHYRDAYVAVENSPKPPPCRISLSYATLAAARNVWVLVTGAGKEGILRESLEPHAKTPLAQLLELRQGTKIMTDFLLRL